MNRQPTFFDSDRRTLQDSLDLTAQSLNAYGADYDHWAIAFSGGKDSSATVAGVDLINADEEARILELIEARTWPRGWDGTEPLASLPFENVNPDGSVQPFMEEIFA